MALSLTSSSSLDTSNALAVDTRSLNRLKVGAGNNNPQAAREAAKQFESLFMREMIKSMREATMKSGLLDSAQGDLGTDLLDQQLSVQMSGPTGCLFEALARQPQAGPGWARNRLGQERNQERRRHQLVQPVRHQGRQGLDGQGGRSDHHRIRGWRTAQNGGEVPRLRLLRRFVPRLCPPDHGKPALRKSPGHRQNRLGRGLRRSAAESRVRYRPGLRPQAQWGHPERAARHGLKQKAEP